MGHDTMAKMGGIRDVNPTFAFLFFAIVMASVALPITSGFVGEFMLLLGLYQYNALFAGFAGLTVVLGAVYMLRSFQTMMLGPANHQTQHFAALTNQEKFLLGLIVVLTLFFGIYPAPLLDLTQVSIDNLLYGLH
jgi:NADH-quinone oxidoreductase subunit M